ncbi:MAG: nitrogen regulation protein NR(I) [Enterobacterales bacterium]|nr:nitrogen regulation protein NR(I) [Enterobacterales bacterium]
MKNKQVLLVDDDASIRFVLNETLTDLGLKVNQTDSVANALDHLKRQDFDLLISDVRMPGASGIDLLKHCQHHHPQLPVIIMTAHSDLDSAVTAYTKGAFEYIPKPFDLDEVCEIVERALSPRVSENIKSVSPPSNRFSIVGEAPAMQNMYRAIGRLSNSHMSVLIKGESGTGKELVAQALHQHSPRKKKPFIALNMAAIPKDLIESELFGHEKGSFTGASGRSLGRFEQADQGTLFLDEIGDMPLDTQTRLLRVLSEGTFYRIGSSQPISVDVRIVAATHQDLLEKVQRGEFREDLYHRLNVIPLELPPLRERADDIALLADFFLSKISDDLNEPKIQISEDAIEKMKRFSWPGNVRQLENTCRWLSVMANSQYITPTDLPTELADDQLIDDDNKWQKQFQNDVNNRFDDGDQNIFISTQEQVEKLLIESALKVSDGKKGEAANHLGWGRNTLARKMKQFGIEDY